MAKCLFLAKQSAKSSLEHREQVPYRSSMAANGIWVAISLRRLLSHAMAATGSLEPIKRLFLCVWICAQGDMRPSDIVILAPNRSWQCWSQSLTKSIVRAHRPDITRSRLHQNAERSSGLNLPPYQQRLLITTLLLGEMASALSNAPKPFFASPTLK